MAEETGRLSVRNFPKSIKEWARTRDINLSEGTRQFWEARMRSDTIEEAVIRARKREKEAALAELEPIVEDLRDDIEDLEAQIANFTNRDGLAEWIDSRPRLVQSTDNPAVQNAAITFHTTPEDIVECHKNAHGEQTTTVGPELSYPHDDA